MKEILVSEYEIPDQDIIIEDSATNTLENTALSINKIDQEVSFEANPRIGLLGADFQLPRIRILSALFGLPEHQSFSSEQIFRLIAHRTGDEQLHQQLDRLLDIEGDLSFPESRFPGISNVEDFQQYAFNLQTSQSALKTPTVFEEQKGEERKGIKKRRTFESFLTRGLMDVPEFWFGYLHYLNDSMLKSAISKTDPDILKKFNLTTATAPDQIRQIIKPYSIAKANGGKRIGLEEFYDITEKNSGLVLAQAELGKGLDGEAKNSVAALEAVRKKLNALASGNS
jgi:hypothetical protein